MCSDGGDDPKQQYPLTLIFVLKSLSRHLPPLIRALIVYTWASMDLAKLARRALAALCNASVNRRWNRSETVDLYEFGPLTCAACKQGRRRKLFGFVLGAGSARTVCRVRVDSPVAELVAVQTWLLDRSVSLA